MNQDNKIYIAGHTGVVGSAIIRLLHKKGFRNLVFRSSGQCDLRRQNCVMEFFEHEKPEYVFLAAGKVGGIMANQNYPADFIYDNLMITCNIIHASFAFKVKKLLNFGSSCIYPKGVRQPISENSLLSGKLEQSNEPYAISKIASIKLCDSYNRQYNTNFNSLIVTNLYGPGDNYNLETAHVLPALIRKFHEAKMKNTEVVLWGTGNARREFMYVDDLADAAVFLMDNNRIDRDHGTINVGCGEDISIKNLAELIKEIIGFTGNIRWDSTKPDGMPRKLLEVTQLNKLGWKHSIALEDGIRKSYDWFLDNTAHLKQS